MNYGINHVEFIGPDDRELLVTFRVTHIGGNDPDDGPEWEFIAATDLETNERVDLDDSQQNEAFEQMLTKDRNLSSTF